MDGQSRDLNESWRQGGTWNHFFEQRIRVCTTGVRVSQTDRTCMRSQSGTSEREAAIAEARRTSRRDSDASAPTRGLLRTVDMRRARRCTWGGGGVGRRWLDTSNRPLDATTCWMMRLLVPMAAIGTSLSRRNWRECRQTRVAGAGGPRPALL